MHYEYSDRLHHGGRHPRLYFIKNGQAYKFVGESIPGVAQITSRPYTKDGKWSYTLWGLELTPGVRALELLSPMHGTWGDNLSSWGEVISVLGLGIDQAKTLVNIEYPETAERLEKAEKFALEVEAQGQVTELVEVAFGSPTNRQISEGWWQAPKTGVSSTGIKIEVAPGSEGWQNPIVLTPEDAKVISSRHSPGMHGGYWTITVVVPI